MPQLPRVTVLGSLNTDISVTVQRLPGPGETVLGSSAVIGSGGKGANQAVAAARLGAEVRMAGCVGEDGFGRQLTAGLAAEGVETSGVRAVAGATSGLALISVDACGENAITVAPGANALAGEQEVGAAFAAECDVLVLSAEIPVSVLTAGLARARAAGVTSVLNLAPVPPGAADLLAGGVDWLVANVPEASVLLGRPLPEPGMPGAGEGRAAAAAARVPPGLWSAAADLAACGARYAVITLGGAGAVVAAGPAPGPGQVQAGGPARGAGAGGRTIWDGRPTLLTGFPVTAVDSVGAGDAFVGALAVALGRGAGPVPAVHAACAAGAAAVTRRGAQAALPTLADVRAATRQEEWPQFRERQPPPGGPGHP